MNRPGDLNGRPVLNLHNHMLCDVILLVLFW